MPATAPCWSIACRSTRWCSISTIGWIVLLTGLSVLVRDVLVRLDTGSWLPLSLAEAWRLFGGGYVESVAALWAAPVLIVPGAALVLLCRRARLRYPPS